VPVSRLKGRHFPSAHGSVKAMKPTRDEYREQAAYAMQMADKAANDELRAQWLNLARKWLHMIPDQAPNAKQNFEQAVHDKGTHQKDSKASH